MKDTHPLTIQQRKVLMFIQERIKENMPPTIREIAGYMGFSSTGTVRDYLNALQRKGYLKRAAKLSRAIELSQKPALGIPILASIAAGKPNTAYEDIEGYLDPDDLFLGRLSLEDVFALRVKGDSMVEAGIMEGDIAIIHKQVTAQHGDIVAALFDSNEATLKRIKFQKNRPFLEPANKNYQPIHKDFTIIGRLITVIRKYA